MNKPTTYGIIFDNGQQLCLLAYSKNQARLLAHHQLSLSIAFVVAFQL